MQVVVWLIMSFASFIFCCVGNEISINAKLMEHENANDFDKYQGALIVIFLVIFFGGGIYLFFRG